MHELRYLHDTQSQQYSVNLRQSKLVNQINQGTDFMELQEIVDHFAPSALIPIQILRDKKNQIKQGVLLDIQFYLSPTQTVYKYNELTALVATLQTIAFIGGFGLMTWLFFKMLCQKY